MTETPELSIYEKAFAKSDKTDAVLATVFKRKWKKLHVNKAVLSYHSDYFNELFNYHLKCQVHGVDFEDFATVLSLVLNVPMEISEFRVESLLKIADRFQLPAAKYHLELILMTTKRDRESLLKLADEYKLDMVMGHVLSGFKCKSELTSNTNEPLGFIKDLSADSKDKVFKRALEIDENTSMPATSTPFIDVYEKTFAKSDKTDAVLVVDGKKLHVNKALLSYHSDYFNTLFNSKISIKLMQEYPIEDVKFKSFAILLSLVQIQPIALTKNNAENVLELSDRFQLRVVRRHIELFLLSSGMHNLEQIRIAEKYEMKNLLEFGIQNLTKANFNNLPEKPVYKGFSSETRSNQKLTKTPVMSTYEKTFAKSDKTDAILVVDRKKLHVNKAVLSYHSDYFNALFNSDFKEKSMEEIEIKDVWFDYFAQCLSLVQNGPMKISENQVDSLLPIADQFQLPAAKHHLEQILMTTNRDRESLLKTADKYKLDTKKKDFISWWINKEPLECIANASDETKNKLFHRALELGDDFSKPTTPAPTISIYESTLAKSDKTDAILLVDGKKLHVNKALLSYHSDYFNALFNSEFKEKSIEEIEIKDVNFEDFATLLSMVQIQPIAPTNENAENILELSDQFQLRVARRHIELFLLSSGMHNLEKIRIGEKYEMNDLLEFVVNHLKRAYFNNLPEKSVYKGFSSETKNKLFYRYLRI